MAPIQGLLSRPLGKNAGDVAFFAETSALGDGDNLDTGLGTITHVVAEEQDDTIADGSIQVATAFVLNGGTVQVEMATIRTHTGGSPEATIAQQANTHTVTVMAIGQRRPPR